MDGGTILALSKAGNVIAIVETGAMAQRVKGQSRRALQDIDHDQQSRYSMLIYASFIPLA